MTFFRTFADRLKEGLLSSQRVFRDGFDRLLSAGRPFDEALLEELEDLLVGADLGAGTAREFVIRVREEVGRGRLTVSDDLRVLLRRHLMEALAEAASPLSLSGRPTVVLILGVNGSGKTTTAGKMAHALRGEGKSVLLAAADTFRAAAIEQLQAWGERAGVEVIRQGPGADPSAVVWDAVKAAIARQVDVLIIDTAGRLHTKTPLMEELAGGVEVAVRDVGMKPPTRRAIPLDPQRLHRWLGLRVDEPEIRTTLARLSGLDLTALEGQFGAGMTQAIDAAKQLGHGATRELEATAAHAKSAAESLTGAGKGAASDALKETTGALKKLLPTSGN